MKNALLSFAWLVLCAATAFANTGDTTILVAHTHTNLASPPSDDDIWVQFPNSSVSYQKILMKFTLGCGTPNCSGWDYTVNTSIGKKDGTIDSVVVAVDSLNHDTTWSYSDHVRYIELGRLITPYGTYMANNTNGFNSSWTHPYYYDVTDYAALLKDSVNVRVHYDGWSDAFSARVEFIFIEGTPSRQVEQVQEIYNRYFDYPNSATFESAVAAKTFYISPDVTSAKVTLTMTGHGSQGEFDPHYVHLNVNGQEVAAQLLWKDDCDMNPVAPQGGTWVFSRANWCPGEKVPIYEIDITPYITPGQNISLDIDMDDFLIQSGASAGYGISAYLITYTQQHANDVMMEEIIAPNSDKPYLHNNPSCTTPIVKIKNVGSQTLTYAEISYWVKGGNKWYYKWHGTLLPFESALVQLPAFDYSGLDTNDRVFYAEADWSNNVPDEYPYNNKLSSHFDMTPKNDSVFYLFFRSNNQPWENSYVLKNEYGGTLYFKNSFAANATYRDTFHLPPGSYAFDFFDFDSVTWGCGDGLRFFVNQPPNASPSDPYYETTGQLSLRKLNNGVIKNFNPEFGRNIHYEFTVGYPMGFNTPKTPPEAPQHNTGINEQDRGNTDLIIYPNPAQGAVNVQVRMTVPGTGVVVLRDIAGRLLQEFPIAAEQEQHFRIPTASLAKGVYLLSLKTATTIQSKRVLVN